LKIFKATFVLGLVIFYWTKQKVISATLSGLWCKICTLQTHGIFIFEANNFNSTRQIKSI